MKVIDTIASRRSVRRFSSRPVEDDKLTKVLEAGRLAPSAKNMQDWKFVVVKDELLRNKLTIAARNQEFVGQAPIVIAACGTSNYVMTCGQYTYTIDVSIAVDHMTLAAVDEGLGTCWIGAFYEDLVKEILGIPNDVRVVALLPLGYPADDSKDRSPVKSRKPLNEIVVYDVWK
jgi:nitroreductase